MVGFWVSWLVGFWCIGCARCLYDWLLWPLGCVLCFGLDFLLGLYGCLVYGVGCDFRSLVCGGYLWVVDSGFWFVGLIRVLVV